ncbi:MAG: endonuclease MutS2 [Deltaproteobacteria bacterium]|nr:endonuclease MutS2 [Deltaproteobacteria bacterium]
MQVDEITATQLGWDEILTALAEEAISPQGLKLCRELKPSNDLTQIRTAQQRCEQLQRLLNDGHNPPLESIEDIDSALTRASKQGVLSAENVRLVGKAMLVTSRIRKFLLNEGHQAGGSLTELARGTHDLSGPGRDLLQAFNDNGELRDSANPELGPLRKTARAIADRIRVRLERLMRKPRVAACLTDTYITERSDRYVLPVRADTHEPFSGIVHDTSQSGATLFIEPAELVEEGNRLKIAQASVADLEHRILAEYSREISDLAADLRDNVACLAEFDRLLAILSLAKKIGGRFIEIGGSGFLLEQARHPLMLLANEPVVANHIRLLAQQGCLVITGPNAGGKTVTLKTIGLIAIMAQAGLPVPAGEGSRIGLFGELHAVIGDAQDIRQGLSTFSAHIRNISQILKTAGPDTLVLLDEIAADTDPRHGAALAGSILTALADLSATTVVTTHFEELKQLAYQDERFANASVGFDLNSMEPTYSLHPDLPGRSLTLDMARRLGVPEPVLVQAAEQLDCSERKIDGMLASLNEELQAVAQLRQELNLRTQAADKLAYEHAKAAADLSDQKLQLLTEGRLDALSEIKQARREVAGVIETLRQNPSMKTAVAASQRLKQTEECIRAQAGPTSAAGDCESITSLNPGDLVLITTLDKKGRISAIDHRAGMISVRFGTMRTRVPLEQVKLVEAKPPLKKKVNFKTEYSDAAKPANPVEVRSPANTLDLRGERVDQALDQLDKFLDDLFKVEADSAFVIHGHGTGALKAAVRQYLKDSPYPRHFRSGAPEEGGDGITIVRLK